MIIITPIGDNLEVGTRAHWDEATQSLYYVDIPESTIYKYKPSTNAITKARVGDEPLAFAFPVEGKTDRFIAGLGRNIVILKWDGETDSCCHCTTVCEVDRHPGGEKNRLNGGKVDPFGRLWAGTMGPQGKDGLTVPGKGSLYSVTKGHVKHHLKDIGISNGLAFDVERKKMYYIDTLFPGVYVFDYDGELGEISNQEVLFKFEDHEIEGLPDGLTIDSDGNLWLTTIKGSAIIQFSPEKKQVLKIIKMPTPHVTSVAFGSQKLNVLYVTTGKIPLDGKIPEDPAGCTFKLLNVHKKGPPGERYKYKEDKVDNKCGEK